MVAALAHDGHSPGTRRRALTIIVADDERDTVATLSAILRDEGHSVLGAYKGPEAIAQARRHKPDVLVIDIDMPGMSGYTVAREVREMFAPWVPLLIAVSGKWVGQTDRMLADLAGFDHFVEKPCDPGLLLRLLEPLRSPAEDTIAPSRKRAMRDPSTLDRQDAPRSGVTLRVLVAEDERDTLMTLGILLRSEGHEVHLVHGSGEVPAAVREFRPHVVLLDIGMPGRDGYEVARELKATLGAACPRLVAVTAYASAAEIARAHASGFDHHVAKPYDPAELLALIGSLA